MPTIGVEYTSKNILLDDFRRVKAQIWDTAGQ
jgi:GTPase SAR1 family protein